MSALAFYDSGANLPLFKDVNFLSLRRMYPNDLLKQNDIYFLHRNTLNHLVFCRNDIYVTGFLNDYSGEEGVLPAYSDLAGARCCRKLSHSKKF